VLLAALVVTVVTCGVASGDQSASVTAHTPAAEVSLLGLQSAIIHRRLTACKYVTTRIWKSVLAAGSPAKPPTDESAPSCERAAIIVLFLPGSFLEQVRAARPLRVVATHVGADVYFKAPFLTPSRFKPTSHPKLWYAEMVHQAGTWRLNNVCTGLGNQVWAHRKQGTCLIRKAA
jgi:hypothetical protein